MDTKQIQSIIQKYRTKTIDHTLKALVFESAEALIEQKWKEMMPDIIAEITVIMEKEILDLRQNVKKGDKGDSPKLGVDYFLPKDGKDGRDGKDADEKKIVDEVVSVVSKKIRQPENGKDAVVDYPFIVSETLKKLPPVKEMTPDTPEEIANKLNTLEEKVDIKVIRGLTNWLTNLKKSIREKSGGGGGGGGMGNFQHESKSVSSSSTFVDTTYNIGGGGFALWVYYQGQMIARGNAYTVSGKRITLLFTPEDNTFIDVIYIRS